MQAITTVGLDIAKSVFQVLGVDAQGGVVIRRQLKRRFALAFFQKLPPCLVGIEACASSHHWSRELKALVRGSLCEQIGILHRRLLAIVRDDDVCRRLMTVPGVGSVVALTYRATIDVPARFQNSKAVGAVFGLTPSKYQAGEINRTGGISRCGDEMIRAMLYEAAHIMLTRTSKWSWLKAWAMKIARRRGMKKAIVAPARRLAVIMHRIWVDGTEFQWTREAAVA
jgi:transposase